MSRPVGSSGNGRKAGWRSPHQSNCCCPLGDSFQRMPMKERAGWSSGWLIPCALILDYGLSFIQAALWADIKWWTDREGCCRKSFSDLATRLHVSTRNLAKMMAVLREAGLIRDVSFDGRAKTIVAIDPQEEPKG